MAPTHGSCSSAYPDSGVPVDDNQSSLKAGLRGPTLLEDFVLRETNPPRV
jgi:catalase